MITKRDVGVFLVGVLLGMVVYVFLWYTPETGRTCLCEFKGNRGEIIYIRGQFEKDYRVVPEEGATIINKVWR